LLIRILFLIAGLSMAAVAGISGIMIGFHAWQDLQTFMFWRNVPATISKLEVVRNDRDVTPYSPLIRYHYTVGSSSYEGTSVTRHDQFGLSQFSSYEEAFEIIEPYDNQDSVTVWVDPEQPSDAVLCRTFPWNLLFIPIPVAFLILGLLISGCALGGQVGVDSVSRVDLGEEERNGFTPKGRRILGSVLVVVSFLCMSVGVMVGWKKVYVPWRLSRVASVWPSVEGIVERSEVLTIDGDDTVSYQPDILYRYEWRGKTFRASRFRVIDTRVRSYRKAQKIVRLFPPGLKVAVLVNPDRPQNALLDRVYWIGNSWCRVRDISA